jgi:hypothetical protein
VAYVVKYKRNSVPVYINTQLQNTQREDRTRRIRNDTIKKSRIVRAVK